MVSREFGVAGVMLLCRMTPLGIGRLIGERTAECRSGRERRDIGYRGGQSNSMRSSEGDISQTEVTASQARARSPPVETSMLSIDPTLPTYQLRPHATPTFISRRVCRTVYGLSNRVFRELRNPYGNGEKRDDASSGVELAIAGEENASGMSLTDISSRTKLTMHTSFTLSAEMSLSKGVKGPLFDQVY